MDLAEALRVLGLPDPVALDDVRASYRRLLRIHHPDVATAPSAGSAGHGGPDARASAEVRTARLIEAYELIVGWAEAECPDGIVSCPPPPAPPAAPARYRLHPEEAFEVIDAQSLDADTIAVDAPLPETYAALCEAAARVGDIAYYDRQLGILETMVRFEGGPTCSVLMTLQGRATFTEVFLTMDSIEAAPTPPIAPVIEALVAELRALA